MLPTGYEVRQRFCYALLGSEGKGIGLNEGVKNTREIQHNRWKLELGNFNLLPFYFTIIEVFFQHTIEEYTSFPLCYIILIHVVVIFLLG